MPTAYSSIMRFELKTENENYSKLTSHFLLIFFVSTLVIVLCNASIKLGIISRQYQIEYNCKLLSVETSNNSIRKLSRLSNLRSKKRIWEFCREIFK